MPENNERVKNVNIMQKIYYSKKYEEKKKITEMKKRAIQLPKMRKSKINENLEKNIAKHRKIT